MVRRHGAERPEHPALLWDGGRLTYCELHDRSSRLAQALISAGVGVGDRVAILGLNSPQHLEIAFATAKLGAVATPVNFRLAGPEAAAIIDDSQAKVLFAGASFADLVADIAPRLSRPVRVICTDREYENWLADFPPADPGFQAQADDTVYQLYSSGTTGMPKGVEITAAGLSACISIYENEFDLAAESVNMIAMPLFHIGGSGMAFAAHLVGATNYIVAKPGPDVLLSTLESHRCTHTTLVPSLMQFMLDVPGVADRDFTALKAIAYGGSPISETLLRRAVAVFGCKFLQAYGLTECTGTVTVLRPADHDLRDVDGGRLRSAGTPLKFVDLQIVDPVTLDVCAIGEVGEIWARGPTAMKGYWRNPELTATTIVDGWVRSGDAGYVDHDGYLYLHDRVKDMIVSGGENIYPADIERVLASHPDVADCAVIAVPHDRWGETPKAIVVAVAGARATDQDLIAHCRSRLAPYKCPTSVDWIDELPRNPAGKVLKKDLRAPYWAADSRQIG